METGVYPPLFLFLASWLLFVGHLSVQWMVLANVPFMVLLALSVFGLGREIDRSRGDSALLAVALLFFYPIVFGLSRSFMVDFAALACIALSAYLLLRTEEFRRPGFAALFGLSLGVGALIKQSVPMALIPPTVYVIARVIIRTARGDLTPWELCRRAGFFLEAAGAALLGAGWWYALHADAIPAMLAVTRTNTLGLATFEPRSILWLARSLTFCQMGWVFCGLFAVGLVLFWRRIDKWNAGFLLTWILGVYLVAIIVPHKSDRQYIAILIPASLVSAITLMSLRRWRGALIGLVCGYGALQMVAFSLPDSPLAAGLSQGNRYLWTAAPRRENWRIVEALASLPRRPATIAVISDHRTINGQVVAYYSASRGLDFTVIKCRDHLDEFLRNPLQYDYFITKTDWAPVEDTSDSPFTPRDADVLVERAFVASRDKLGLLRRYPLPDGSEMLLLERRVEGARR
jgi:4-amino-4-deoxy-L-arabinose transferase-like glycosyltransferase